MPIAAIDPRRRAATAPTSGEVVVLVSHTAPPQANAGAGRLEGFVRHLPDHGWRPVVVGSAFAGDGGVGAAPTLRPSEPLVAYQRRFASSSANNGSPDQAGPVKALVMERLAVPDLHAGWVPGAAFAAVRAAREHGAAALFSSSPSEASHLAALVASRLTGLPWVAELRDGWLVEGLKDLESHPVRRRVERTLERAVAHHASALVGVTRPIAADLSARYGSASWIPNGFEQSSPPAAAIDEARALLDSAAFNFVYTGTFSRSRASRSPAVLAEAFGRVSSEAAGERPVALTVLGRIEPAERELLARVPGVRLVEHRSRDVALALQRLADALVVVTQPGEPTIATGKLLEYLGAGRPILALAEGNEAARLVTELGVGLVADPADPGAVAGAIARVLRGEAPALPPDSPDLAGFTRAGVAGRLAALLDQVTAQAPAARDERPG